MKPDKLDLEFLLRAKNKPDQNEGGGESEDDTLNLQPELLSGEDTSEYEINEDAVDLMWVLEKKKQGREQEQKQGEAPEPEDTAEAKTVEIETTDESEPAIEQETEWEPLILPEEPGLQSEEEQRIPALSHQDDLKLIIEEIDSHQKLAGEEKPEPPESSPREVGIKNQFDEQNLKFELEQGAYPDINKEEINELIDIVQPEDTEHAFALEEPDLSPQIPDITNLLRETEEDAKLFSAEDDALNVGLSLRPPVPEDMQEKTESSEQPVPSRAEPGAPGSADSAFSGFIKERQQASHDKGAHPARVLPKTKQHSPRFKKSNQFTFKDLFESHSLLGLDIGSDSIKTVHLKKSGRSLKLINLRVSQMPTIDHDYTREEKIQIFARHLSENINVKAFKNAVIRTAISGMEVVFKNVQVPQMAKKDLAKAVPWACRKDFPFPLESTVFDFKNITEVEKKGGKWDMFVVAAQKELINNHLNLLAPARIVPAKISTIPEALWRAFQLSCQKDRDKCHILVDIGANSSHIVFINKGRLQFAREISTGGADFTKSLAGVFFVDGREIEISTEVAEKIKQQYGLPAGEAEVITDEGIPLQEFSVMMGPVLERLISNIQRTIEFYKEKFQVREIDNLHLTGGGSLMANLPEKLAGELNLNVKLFNPFDFISVKNADNIDSLRSKGPLFAVPVGLAIGKVSELNLLPAELKESFTIEYLKKIYKYIFIIFILAMAFLSQNAAGKIADVQAEFRRLNMELRNSEPMRKKYLTLQKTHQNLLAVKSRYGNSLESDIHAVNYLKIISLAIPKNITLTSLRIFYRQIKNDNAQNKGNKAKEQEKVEVVEKEFVVLDGIAFESNSMEGMNLATFLLELGKANCFEAISLTSQKIREDGSLQFSIECQPYEAE